MSDTSKRIILVTIGIIAFAFLLNWSRGRDGGSYDGTAEWRADRSEFYLQGSCSSSPWWLDTQAEGTYEIQKRWEALGKPAAVRVVFVGDLTMLGRFGNDGKYWRAIRPRAVIDVTPLTQACK
jgi:hypothetical protein